MIRPIGERRNHPKQPTPNHPEKQFPHTTDTSMHKIREHQKLTVNWYAFRKTNASHNDAGCEPKSPNSVSQAKPPSNDSRTTTNNRHLQQNPAMVQSHIHATTTSRRIRSTVGQQMPISPGDSGYANPHSLNEDCI
jgi:hypothetical protein